MAQGCPHPPSRQAEQGSGSHRSPGETSSESSSPKQLVPKLRPVSSPQERPRNWSTCPEHAHQRTTTSRSIPAPLQEQETGRTTLMDTAVCRHHLQYTELSLSRGTDGDVATADASASGEMKRVVRSEGDRDTALLSFVPFSFVTWTTALTSMDHTNTTQQQLMT